MGDESRFRYRLLDEGQTREGAAVARAPLPEQRGQEPRARAPRDYGRAEPSFAAAPRRDVPREAAPASAPAGREGAQDSLAELAKLIGDQDPFADFAEPEADAGARTAAYEAPEPQAEPPVEDRGAGAGRTRRYGASLGDARARPAAYDPKPVQDDRAYEARAHEGRAQDAHGYDAHGYDEAAYDDRAQGEPAYDERAYGRGVADERAYGTAYDEDGPGASGSAGYGQEPEAYDDYAPPAPPAPRAPQLPARLSASRAEPTVAAPQVSARSSAASLAAATPARTGGAVRTGYGSLARQAALPSPAPTRDDGYGAYDARSADGRGYAARGYDEQGRDARGYDPRYDQADAGYEAEARDTRGYDDRSYDGRARDDQAYDDRAYDERRADERAYDDRAYGARSPAGRDYDERAYDDRAHDDRAYDDRAYGGRAQDSRAQDSRAQDTRTQDPRVQDSRAYDDQGYDDEAYDDQAYDDAGYDRREPAADARGYRDDGRAYGRGEAAYAYADRRGADDGYDAYDDAYDPDYADDGYMPPHGEEVYETEPRRRKGRMALLMVASVIGLVVAGIAAFFAYRMAVGAPGFVSSGTPPVIRADATPAKVVTPPPPASDGQQKLIYDRVGDGASPNERMVPREEQPVDVATTSSGTTGAAATEPKRVRTLTVRADGSIVQDGAPSEASPIPPGGSVTAYAPNQNPIPTGLPAPTTVSTVPAGAPQATASTNPPVSASGAYVVQVASQRSEADAMGSWRALQQRYPSLLGSYRASVKRADLGERGVYYRAQVGPFASRDQANELCQALRSQGGDCLVNKN